MSITLEQIIQTLESLVPQEEKYSIVYYTTGIRFDFHILKKIDPYGRIFYKFHWVNFACRSMGEFLAIRTGQHYIEYLDTTEDVTRCHGNVHWTAKKILKVLDDSEKHRMMNYVIERSRMERGPIIKRGENVAQAEYQFFIEKMDETRGNGNFRVPVELRSMVLNLKHQDSDEDSEEFNMYMAQQVVLFHSLHGQMPEA
jgi:hypothetical protein